MGRRERGKHTGYPTSTLVSSQAGESPPSATTLDAFKGAARTLRSVLAFPWPDQWGMMARRRSNTYKEVGNAFRETPLTRRAAVVTLVTRLRFAECAAMSPTTTGSSHVPSLARAHVAVPPSSLVGAIVVVTFGYPRRPRQP